MFCFALGSAQLSENVSAPTISQVETPKPASGQTVEQLACKEFNSLAYDIDAGILIDSEMRERAKVVYLIAKDSRSLGKTAEMFLSAATNKEENKLQISYASMLVLCNAQ